MLGVTQMLLKTGLRAAARLPEIIQAGRTLLTILNDILDYSKCRPDGSGCARRPGLRASIDNAVAVFGAQARREEPGPRCIDRPC